MSSIVKVIEVISQSDKSFDDALRNAVKEAGKTVTGMKTIWVDNFSAEIDGNAIKQFRVNAKISFVLDAKKQ